MQEGDVIMCDFGHERKFPGVVYMHNRQFLCLSVPAAEKSIGHSGVFEAMRRIGAAETFGPDLLKHGHWWLMLDTDEQCIVQPPDAAVLFDLDRFLTAAKSSNSAPHVRLNCVGRLRYNVANDHGGPYGKGKLMHISGNSVTVKWDGWPDAQIYPLSCLEMLVPAQYTLFGNPEETAVYAPVRKSQTSSRIRTQPRARGATCSKKCCAPSPTENTITWRNQADLNALIGSRVILSTVGKEKWGDQGKGGLGTLTSQQSQRENLCVWWVRVVWDDDDPNFYSNGDLALADAANLVKQLLLWKDPTYDT